MRWLSVFSLISLPSLLAILIALIVILCAHFGWIDKGGRFANIANEIIANQSGIPLEEIKVLEGLDKPEKKD